MSKDMRSRLDALRAYPKLREAQLEEIEALRCKAQDMGLVPQYCIEPVSHSSSTGEGRQELIHRIVDLQADIVNAQSEMDTSFINMMELIHRLKEPTQIRAVIAYYVTGKTQLEIADELGLADDRSVRRILQQAIVTLEQLDR